MVQCNVLKSLVIFGFVLAYSYSKVNIETASWQRTFVEKRKIDKRVSSVFQEEIVTIHSTKSYYVLPEAFAHDWVTSVCILSSTELLLSTVRISPYYESNDVSNSYVCFTNLPRDLVFGKTIIGPSIVHQTNLHKTEQNLVKGFYNGQTGFCSYYISNSVDKWIEVDLGSPQLVTAVSFSTIKYSSSSFYLKAGDIWIGNSSSVNGDFSTGFDLFASYSDFSNAEHREIRGQHQMTGRFLGIKQNSGSIMYMCDLMVI